MSTSCHVPVNITRGEAGKTRAENLLPAC